jgi:hypothetical protein
MHYLLALATEKVPTDDYIQAVLSRYDSENEDSDEIKILDYYVKQTEQTGRFVGAKSGQFENILPAAPSYLILPTVTIDSGIFKYVSFDDIYEYDSQNGRYYNPFNLFLSSKVLKQNWEGLNWEDKSDFPLPYITYFDIHN